MKKIFKYLTTATFASAMIFTSCETLELELLENPNALSSDQADPALLLNSIQLDYRTNISVFGGNGSELTRIENFNNRDYFEGLTGGTLNGNWTRTYANIIPNVAAIEALNANATTPGSLNYQEGVAKALLGHNLMLMVDYIGDVPLSQTNQPLEFPNPTLDDDAEVYAAALALLDEASTLIGTNAGTDLYYSNAGQWQRFINTVRLKAAITTGDLSTFDSIISGDNFIAAVDDELQWQYGTQEVNPDERHYNYANDYTPSGANVYQSNWLMNLMNTNDDPRIRYYFVRQSVCTPGASCDPAGDGESISCSIETPPAHYTTGGFTFCFLEDGYWGRDHGDDDGVPPDGLQRTAHGVYPASGFFDDSDLRFNADGEPSPRKVGLGLAGAGAGILPIMLSSEVKFWQAERAMIDGDTGSAIDFIKEGITLSAEKVYDFASLDANRLTLDASGNSIESDAADTVAFANAIEADFNAGSMEDKWNILAEQYFVSQFGNGTEAYNFYRRQGYPTTLQPNIEPSPGTFPRSFPYATGEIIANPNINQKADNTTQVFWDTNPPSAPTGGFPASN